MATWTLPRGKEKRKKLFLANALKHEFCGELLRQVLSTNNWHFLFEFKPLKSKYWQICPSRKNSMRILKKKHRMHNFWNNFIRKLLTGSRLSRCVLHLALEMCYLLFHAKLKKKIKNRGISICVTNNLYILSDKSNFHCSSSVNKHK